MLALALSVGLLALPTAQRSEPFVPVGVRYDAAGAPASKILRDLQTIRSLGFNHIKVFVEWASAEPARGEYRLEPLDQILTLAAESGLKVIVDLKVDRPPAWLDTKAVDPLPVTSFVDAVSARAASQRSFHGIDAKLYPFRTSVHPRRVAASWSPVELGWYLDEIRSAAGDRGWAVSELQSARDTSAANKEHDVMGPDVRLWGWTALAHGARAVTYDSWTQFVDADGGITARARAAGEFAGIVSRNPALFAPLRPRPSRVAIVRDLRREAAVSSGAPTSGPNLPRQFYEQMFNRNIPVDFVSQDQLAGESARRYPVMFFGWAGPTVPDLSAVESDVTIDRGAGIVEARFLESSDAIVLIAINHAETPMVVTFTFAPGTPEAIWQNMATGASVSFVQGGAALTHRHVFGARDVLVLMIRKKLR